MPDTAFLLALVGAVLGAASMVLHVVAPRTKNTIDDQLRDDIDEVLAFARGQKAAPALTVAKPPSSSGTGVAVLALVVLGLAGAATLTGCATTKPALAAGAIAALDCEAADLKPADLTDATALATALVQHWLAGGVAASTAAIKADLAPFKTDLGKCALAGSLALATAALAPAPGTVTQGLISLSPTAPPPDPAQLRAAFSLAARQLGWPAVKVGAAGVVL